MEETLISEYCAALTKLGIGNMRVEHPSMKSIKDVLDHLQLSFADCVPTLIMKADDGFIAVVIRGDTKADFKKIKKELGISDLRMATPDEFTQLTGLPIGAARVYTSGVSKTIIDKKVLEKEYLMGGSGSFSCSIRYKTADLTKIPESVVVEITNTPQTV